MMKFGKKLEVEAVEAWKLHYIDYGHLKRFMKLLLTEEIDSKVRESKFKVDLEKQRVQASTFYAQHKHILQTNLQLLLKSRSKLQSSNNVNKLDQIESLLISFRTLNDELNELKKFADLNVEGFHKILKKFDKWNKSQLGEIYKKNSLENEPFYQQKEIKEMKEILEKEIKELENSRSQSVVVLDTFSENNEIQKMMRSPEIYESQIENLLHSCIVAGKIDIVKTLIEKGNILNKDEFDRSLLHVCHPNCLDFLLEFSYKTNQLSSLSKMQDNHKKSPLHIFSEKGYSSALNFLLSKVGTESIDLIDSLSMTPLLLACNKGNYECVKVLLSFGANIKVVDNCGNTCVHLAAKLGNKPSLENLLTNVECPVNQVNSEKESPLHLATFHRHHDCVELLLQHNAVDSQDAEGNTCLHYAASNGEASTLKLLINNNFINVQNLDGYTPLHCATQENRMNVVDILLSAGAKVDIVDNDGWTAEAYAAYIGNIPLADKVKASDWDKNQLIPGNFPVSTPLNKAESPIFPESPPDSRNNQQKNVQELLCRVEFKVTAVTALGQYVAVVGDRKVLGSWEPLKSLPLTPITVPTSSVAVETDWVGHVYLPVRVATKYRYIIMEGSQILKWETLPSPRVLRPHGKTYIAEDGSFGVDPQSPIPAQYVDEGWLIDESQIRIRFRPDAGLTLYDNLPHLRVLLSTKEPYNLIDTIEFPLSQEDRDYIVQGRFSPEKLVTLQYDVYSKNVLVGRAVVHPSLMKALKGHMIVPVINTQLNVVGEISFYYLVVTPFSHPDLSKALRDTFWKSTSLIGHRGGGADSSSKIGAFHRSHIQENTLLSFVTASSLGAEYVEFDVQLTKDNVPIIYHNWTIPDPQSSCNIEVPIGEITLKQLKGLRAKKSAIQKRFGRSRSNSLSILTRNSSQEDLSQLPMETSTTSHNGDGSFIEDSFPTLEECFKKIPMKTGFNIEMKYPLPENVREYSLHSIPERNDYCNRILDLVFTYAQDRKIMFSSFDPDICTLLSLKQPRYPVFFLTHSGTPQYQDPRCNSIREAVQFAKAQKLTGIVAESKPLIRCPQLITVTKKSGILLATYGVLNNQAECAQLQEQLGVDAIIVDHVAYVNKHLKV